MGKTGVECIQYEYLGVKGKKGKEDFFFIPLVAVSLLLSRLPGHHLVSACVLYPGHKSTSQAILCGQ